MASKFPFPEFDIPKPAFLLEGNASQKRGKRAITMMSQKRKACTIHDVLGIEQLVLAQLTAGASVCHIVGHAFTCTMHACTVMHTGQFTLLQKQTP